MTHPAVAPAVLRSHPAHGREAHVSAVGPDFDSRRDSGRVSVPYCGQGSSLDTSTADLTIAYFTSSLYLITDLQQQSPSEDHAFNCLACTQAHLDDDARAAVSFGRGALGTKALAEAIMSATPAAYFMSLIRK